MENNYITENWKPVPGFGERYWVSDQGRFRRINKDGNPSVILKARSNRDGYQYVPLRLDGRTKSISVHRTVLEAFRGPCPENHFGCHRNDDKTDNRLDNLYWGTSWNNFHDAELNGKLNRTKLNPEKVREARKLHERGWGYRSLGNRYGVSPEAIRQVFHGKSWAWVK